MTKNQPSVGSMFAGIGGTAEKPTSDTHRYKQLGNAVTVNVAEWIARRAMDCLQ